MQVRCIFPHVLCQCTVMILKVGNRTVHCCKETNQQGGQSYFLCAHDGDVSSLASFSIVNDTLRVDQTDLGLRIAILDTLAIFTKTEEKYAKIKMVPVDREGSFVIVSNDHVLEQEADDLYHFSWRLDRQNNGAVFTIEEADVGQEMEGPVTEIIDETEESVDVTELEQKFARLQEHFKELSEKIQSGEIKPDFFSDDELSE